MSHAECPHCEGRIRLSGGPRLGQKVTCPRCGEKLEVIRIDPVELDYEYDDYNDEEYQDYLDEDD